MVTQVDLLPDSDTLKLYRHFSIGEQPYNVPPPQLAGRSGGRQAIAKSYEEVRKRLTQLRGDATAEVRERPFYVSGRKGRPALRDNLLVELLNS